jgi:hypothetical protein
MMLAQFDLGRGSTDRGKGGNSDISGSLWTDGPAAAHDQAVGEGSRVGGADCGDACNRNISGIRCINNLSGGFEGHRRLGCNWFKIPELGGTQLGRR